MVTRVLRKSFATIACFVAVQAVVLAVGWILVYNATHERVAQSVDEVIIDNNRRVAVSLVDAIGSLPDRFDPEDPAWQRAQQLVERVDFGSGGFACILDETGHIACHPDIDEQPALRNINLAQHMIDPVGGDGPTTIGELGRTGVNVGVTEFMFDGRHYVATKMLTESGARLVVHQPVSGLTAASAQVTGGLLVRMGIAAAPTLLLTVAIGVWFIRSHSRAVRTWNAQLESTVAERTEQLSRSRRAIVTALATLADYRDNETGQHVLRIGEYTVVLAKALQGRFPEIDTAYIERIRLASMLHDIGKVGVPDAILRKPGKLTPEEFEVIKTHPNLGADTLIAVHREIERDPLIQMAVEISLYHHERWDGTGYPVGLSNEDIPLAARITAVADVFDALMSPRVYKPAMPFDQVCTIIRESSGTHFDPAVVESFESVAGELRAIRASLAEADAPAQAA